MAYVQYTTIVCTHDVVSACESAWLERSVLLLGLFLPRLHLLAHHRAATTCTARLTCNALSVTVHLWQHIARPPVLFDDVHAAVGLILARPLVRHAAGCHGAVGVEKADLCNAAADDERYGVVAAIVSHLHRPAVGVTDVAPTSALQTATHNQRHTLSQQSSDASQRRMGVLRVRLCVLCVAVIELTLHTSMKFLPMDDLAFIIVVMLPRPPMYSLV